MLKIFNDLKPFFEDVYREISVRQYSKISKISPPTASNSLKNYEIENLLISNKKGIYIYFRANRENYIFGNLAKLYWYSVIYPLTESLHEKILYKRIILFGSLAKAENTMDSDVDLYLDIDEKEIDSSEMQRVLKREIQLHFKKSLKNNHLKENIEEGVTIR